MRRQQDGLLIHTASMAGRFIGGLSGAAYTAAKHGVVAMSHSINMQECINGIRSTVVLPGEVATPILEKRPVPVSAEERARMLQSADVGDLIRYIACLPRHMCMNEVMVAPTWNRTYVAALNRPKL
jgi:NADP-dependent 3-hydroxy acid dehydrogenase YdfG